MLVVNLHALQTVDVLDLANQVISQFFGSAQAQDVMRIELAVSDNFATNDLLTLKHVKANPLRNQHFVGRIFAGDYQANLALGFLAEADGTRMLSQNSRFLGLPGFEQVSNPGQTTGDVTSLRRFLRDTCNNVTQGHLVAIIQTDDRASRQSVDRGNLGIGEEDGLALGIHQFGHRALILTSSTSLLGIKHHNTAQARDVVDLARNGNTVLKVFESHDT